MESRQNKKPRKTLAFSGECGIFILAYSYGTSSTNVRDHNLRLLFFYNSYFQIIPNQPSFL